MQVHRDIESLPKFTNAVITIGSYDGVHIGHRKIIQKLNAKAKKIDGESVIISFHPHPRKIIYPNDKSLVLLNTVDEKIALLSKLGVDHLVLVPFTIEYSQQHPLEYIENFIVKNFSPSCIVIGYDHRFGKNREGNIDLLKENSDRLGYQIEEIKKQNIDDIAVSSTRIRASIQDGNIAEANRLLGSCYRFSGIVIHGEKVGEFLGFPTANLELTDEHKLVPSEGIYAVRINIESNEYEGMMYIGKKPTLHEENDNSIEVNIFNFKDSLYDKEIQVEIVDFVREDKKFDSLEELKAGIAADKVKVELILASQDQKKKSVL